MHKKRMINRFIYIVNVNTYFSSRPQFFGIMSKKKKTMNVNDSKQEDNAAIGCDKSNNIIIQVLAKPGAKQNRITGCTDEGVAVQINAPPTEGEANAELVKYMSSVLGLRKSDIVFDKGFKSRSKTLKILNGTTTLAEVRKKIEDEINI